MTGHRRARAARSRPFAVVPISLGPRAAVQLTTVARAAPAPSAAHTSGQRPGSPASTGGMNTPLTAIPSPAPEK